MIFLVVVDIAFAGYIQLDGVADVKTRFSRGCYTVKEIAELARVRGIDTVIFGDQARDTLEYGLFPFERIIRKQYEKSSVLTVGASAYTSEINDNDEQFKETLLVPGTEVAPFYYWTEKGALVANNTDKHLFVVGFGGPEPYEQLPILNSNFSKRYLAQYQSFFGGCAALFFLCIIAIMKGYKKKTYSILASIMFLLAINNQPFRSSPFNQYSGDQGVQPYQQLIDYVNDSGALVFWNHMEADGGIRQEGQISYKTEPYPEDLMLTSGYTGFQSAANFPVTQIEPGNEWDNVLGGYLEGTRKKPVWGYGGSNYLCEDGEIKLGGIRTIFLVRKKSRDDILEAMARGRMYAVRQTGVERLSLDDFTISDIKSGRKATMGEELRSSDFPELKIKVRLTKGTEQTVHLSIIRNGSEVKQETITLPYELTWRDVDFNREEGPVFYRLKVEADSENYLVSNPIFVHFDGGLEAQLASVPQDVTEEINMVEPTKPIKPVEPVKPLEHVELQVKLPQSPISSSVQSSEKTVQHKMVPSLPKLLETENMLTAKVTPPTLKKPALPEVKIPSALAPVAPFKVGDKLVVAKINGVSLKNGPGPKFPEVGRLNKGDSLPFIRSTSVKFNGKPWLMVNAGGRKVYVWSELVARE